MIEKLQSEKKYFTKGDQVRKSESSGGGGAGGGLEVDASSAPSGGAGAGATGTGGMGGDPNEQNRRVSKFDSERKYSRVDPMG
jgi:hypothetical protein